MNMETTSWSKSKLVLLGSVLFLSSLFFGGQAKAAATDCIWAAASAANYSSTTAWKQANGSACVIPTATSITFQGASSTADIIFDVSTTTPSITFDSAYTGNASIAASITVTSTGSVTVNGGTFVTAALSNFVTQLNLNVSSTGSFTINGGLRVGGNLTVTSTFNSVTGVVEFTSSTVQTISGPGNITFNELWITGEGNTVTLASSVTTTGQLSIDINSTFNLGSSNLVAGDSILSSGTTTQTSGTVTMTGASKILEGPGNITLYNLVISGSEVLAGNVTTTNNLTVNSGASLNLATYNAVVSSSFSNAGTVTQTSGTVTLTGSGILGGAGSTTLAGLNVSGTTTLAGNLSVSTTVVSGSFTAGGKTLTLTGLGNPLNITGPFNVNTSTIQYSSASSNVSTTINFYNLTIAGTATLVGNVTTTNNLTVNYGATLNLATFGAVVSSSFSNAGTVTQTSGTVTLTGTGNLGGAGNTTLANINITGTSTLAGNVTSTAVATITGSLSGGSSTLTLTATGTPFVKIGTFNVNTSSITYTGGSGATNIASTTYYNLTINTGGAVLTGNTTSTNNLTVNSGASLNLATYNAVVSSSFSNAGTVTQTSGTVTLTGTGN
ncbi:MAG: hypothetical protein WCV83_01115, partial [Candidatus Magasanikbacteria bacterium]